MRLLHNSGYSPDTEIPEDRVEDLIHFDLAGKPAQGAGGEAQIFRGQFRKLEQRGRGKAERQSSSALR